MNEKEKDRDSGTEQYVYIKGYKSHKCLIYMRMHDNFMLCRLLMKFNVESVR